MENSRQINIASNNFRRHTPEMGMGVRLVDSTDCIVNGCHLQDEAQEGQASGASPLELVRCRRINVTGCQVLDGVPYGLDLANCDHVNITGCTIMDTRKVRRSQGAVRWIGPGAVSFLSANTLGYGEAALQLDQRAGVILGENLIEE